MLIDFNHAINSSSHNMHIKPALDGRFLQVIPRLELQKGTPPPVGANLEIPCPKKRNAVSLANAKTEDHCSLF